MKTILTVCLLFLCSTGMAQKKKSSDSTSSYISNVGVMTFTTPANYTYLFIGGRVGMEAKNAWILIVRDTSKLCIKYQDSIFVLHISPKFVKKINDSTYTFINK